MANLGIDPGNILYYNGVALVYNGDPNVGAQILDLETTSVRLNITSSGSTIGTNVKPICGWVSSISNYNTDYVIIFENG